MATKARPPRTVPAPGAEPASAPHPAELWACQAAVVVGGLLMLRATREIFNLGRATALALLAVAVGGMLATMARRPRWRRPSAQVAVVAALAAAVVLTWLITPSLSSGFFGPYSRQTGAAMYLTGIALFLAMARQRGELAVRTLLGTLAVAAGLAVTYGVLQGLGADPFTWGDLTLGKVFSTFGQVNFTAGYLGVVTPALLYFALRVDLAPIARGLGAFACLGSLYVVVETHSFQGIVALGVGVLPLALYLLRPAFDRLPSRQRALGALGVAVVVVVLGLLAAGFLRSQLSSGLRERILLWRAALAMFGDHPILGQGFGAFVDHFFHYRPEEHAVRYGLAGADAPHSVPLEMLVNGGIVLFTAYAAFVAWTARALVRAVRLRRDMLVAAVGGAWLAYQLQSFVSFDVPALLTLHFLLAGCIVALGREPAAAPRRPMRAPAIDWNPVLVAVAAMVVLAWPLTAPLRADLLAHRGEERVKTQQGEQAVADLHQAWRTHHTGVYAAEEASLLISLGHVGRAVDAGRRAVAASPGAVQYIVTLGKLELQTGDLRTAEQTFERAIRTNPRDAAMLTDIGVAYTSKGIPKDAIPYLRRSIRITPTPEAWDQLSIAYSHLSQVDKAVEANNEAAALRAAG